MNRRIFLASIVLLFTAGCGGPIYELNDFEPDVAKTSLSSDDSSQRYEWPLTSAGFLVAKPPQLAYVTSFGSPLTVPDRVDSPLVPWSDEDLHPAASGLLHDFYDPIQKELTVHATIAATKLCGSLAFDVSYDGKRMVTVEYDDREKRRLGLYKMSDGSLIGYMKLPSAIAKQDIQAIRFCGDNSDFMLASAEKIFRLSGKDGSVMSSVKGPGEKISKWTIAADGESMALLTRSGRVLYGDTMMKHFSLFNFGKNISVPDVALSPDGLRLITVVGKQLRIYGLQNYQKAGHTDLSELEFGTDNVAVASGNSTDAWVNGKRIAYATQSGKNSYEMFWRPSWVSPCTQDNKTNWFLTIGSRLKDGTEELVLFDFGPNSRNHSAAIVLHEMPEQIQHNSLGDHLAILDSQGLRICQRRSYQTNSQIYLYPQVYQLIEEADLDQIDKVCEIIRSQKRYGDSRVPSELISILITAVRNVWISLKRSDPDSQSLKKIEAWYAKGGGVALATSASRHLALGWEARGTGTYDTVSQAGSLEYQKRLKLTMIDAEKALASDFVTYTALRDRISVGLETDESFEDIDKFCRQATLLSPDDPSLGKQIAYKLLPQWYGEPGDTISFALSSARTLSGLDADLLYARLIGEVAGTVRNPNRTYWASYDLNRIKRGIHEYGRRQLYPTTSLWYCYAQNASRLNDTETVDQALSYIISMQAAAYPGFQETCLAAPYSRSSIARIRK